MIIANIFYALGIFYMIIGIGVLFAIIILIFVIKKQVTDFTHTVEQKLNFLTGLPNRLADNATGIGALVMKTAVKNISRFTRKKR